jgi:hypothetical protein
MTDPALVERRTELAGKLMSDDPGLSPDDADKKADAVIRVEEIAPQSLTAIRELDVARTWYWDFIATVGIFLIVGKKACYKSWVALWLLWHTSAGLPFLGRVTKKAPCLYCALELDEIAMAERAKKLPPSDGIIDVVFSLPRGQAALDALEALIIARGYRVIVIDMLPAILPADSDGNGYTETTVFMLALRRLAQKHSACIVCLMHAGKAERVDYVDSVIGSTAYAGQSDTVAVLSRKRKERVLQLSASGNHGKDTFLSIRVNDDLSLELAEDDGGNDAGLSPEASRIVSLLNETYPAGTSPSVLASVVGKPPEAVRQSLLRLCDRGIVERSGRGNYRIPSTVIPDPPEF